MLILGIESSCDETSIAVVKDGKEVLCNIINSQIDIHKKYGGVVPEIASRQHISNISYVFYEALEKANIKLNDIDYIAVTNKPGLIGSLLVGLMFAKGLSIRNNIDLIPINHLIGHIYSTFLENEVKLPAISVVASGGHSSIYYMSENHKLELIGETQDDAIGEAYDKVARLLGLEYPGGPNIEKLAKKHIEKIDIKLPNVKNYDLSFSGIKTFITNYINQANMKNIDINKADIAYSFQEVALEHFCSKIIKAVKDYNVKTLAIAGGVSANKRFREILENSPELKGIELNFPVKMSYCTDNGAMIAAACYYELKYGEKNLETDFDAVSTKEYHRI